MNLHVTEQFFEDFFMIQAQTYILIFCLTQASFARFFHATCKISLYRLQTYYTRFCTNHGNFSMHFHKIWAIKFFVIVINYSFHLFYLCKPRNTWYWPYVCNLIKIRILNTLSPFFLRKKNKKNYGKGMLDCKN